MENCDILIKNFMMIDGTRKEPYFNTIIIINDGKIIEIGENGIEKLYTSSMILDLKGMTLLPGFINAHVHIDFNNPEYLKKWIHSGVTTIREMGILNDADISLAIAKRKNNLHSAEFPRIVMSGKFFTAPGGYGGCNPIGVSTKEEVGQKVNELLDAGCDFIKTVLEDGFDPSTFGLPKLSPEILKVICDEAHKRGVWVSAHVSQVHNLEIVVEAGVNEVTHNVYDHLPTELINKMVAKNVYMIPTMNLYKAFSDKYGSPFYQTCVDNLIRFIDAGGKIAVGTDFIEEDLPWFNLGMTVYEMELLKEAGLNNMNIILAATRTASEVLGMNDMIGTIEKGKVADLIVINGNPLLNLKCLADVMVVIKDGVIVRNEL
jgi:imidazolonepropionase-like amidohydrolase